MIASHPFWFVLVAACVIWYSTITLYVAVQGVGDIRRMLRELSMRDTRTNVDQRQD